MTDEKSLKPHLGIIEVDVTTSPEVDQLFAALSKFQQQLERIIAGKQFDLHSKPDANGNRKKLATVKYAEMSDLQERCKAPLADNGLAVLQPIGHDRIHTIVTHSSGQWIRSSVGLPKSDSNQSFGGNVSYMRRYAYSAALGLVVDEEELDPKGKERDGKEEEGEKAGGKVNQPAAGKKKTPFNDANMPSYVKFITGTDDQYNKALERLKEHTLTADQKRQFEDAAKSVKREIVWE